MLLVKVVIGRRDVSAFVSDILVLLILLLSRFIQLFFFNFLCKSQGNLLCHFGHLLLSVIEAS